LRRLDERGGKGGSFISRGEVGSRVSLKKEEALAKKMKAVSLFELKREEPSIPGGRGQECRGSEKKSPHLLEKGGEERAPDSLMS